MIVIILFGVTHSVAGSALLDDLRRRIKTKVSKAVREHSPEDVDVFFPTDLAHLDNQDRVFATIHMDISLEGNEAEELSDALGGVLTWAFPEKKIRVKCGSDKQKNMEGSRIGL